MYQLRDIYNESLNKKVIILPNIHTLHQRRDQITGVEEQKSDIRKKKKQLTARVNQNLRNRQIAKLAQAFLKNNEPVSFEENGINAQHS
jgi:hypothetical protein